jgi:hypothetical protein
MGVDGREWDWGGAARHRANGRAVSIVHDRDGHGHIRVYLDLLAFICVESCLL